MQVVNCKNPHRVFNKYIGEYVFVPCGKCSVCKNRRAAHYTQLLERERLEHRYCFFVTLTYDNAHVPLLSFGDFQIRKEVSSTDVFYSNREGDFDCIPFCDLFPEDDFFNYEQADIDFFKSWIMHGGLPYASKRDVQLFLKRLNKYFFQNVTYQFKNFRYFVVSEYGSTTFRPHFHGIFFVDNPRCAERFADAVSACWKYGINDSQYVENSACGYVSQYINKSDDLPYVYGHCKQIKPFFLCSRNPFIGTLRKCAEDDVEIIDKCSVETYSRKSAKCTKLDVVPLEQSYQNRLFPKCVLFGSLPDSLRVECYTSCLRFGFDSLKGFLNNVYDYLASDSKEDFAIMLRLKVGFSSLRDRIFHLDHRNPYVLFDDTSFNFLRRLYYISKRVARQALQYGFSLKTYINKILEYYRQKELYMLKKQYELQVQVADDDSPETIACMYPDFLHRVGLTLKEYLDISPCISVVNYLKNQDYFAFSNKKSHFKNAYLDSLQLKRDSQFIYLTIKTFLYAKKCNETLEAFAT